MLNRYIGISTKEQAKKQLSLTNIIHYIIFGNVETQEEIEEIPKIKDDDINVITQKLKQMTPDVFMNYMRTVDKTSPIIIDMDTYGLVDSPVNTLSLVSSLLRKMIDSDCYINLTFDKMLITRLFCDAHNIPYKEYAIMYGLKNSDSKLVQGLTITEHSDVESLPSFEFKSIEEAIAQQMKSIPVRPLIKNYVFKDITGMHIEKYYVGDFIKRVFL